MSSKVQRPSRYKEGFDYDHRFHAGNAGDVFKHCALRLWTLQLQTSQADGTPLHMVDTHAGGGMFKLGTQGEWREGIGRLDESLRRHRSAASTPAIPAPVWEYWQASGTKRQADSGGLYPGSPALLRAMMRPQDRLTLCELVEAPATRLRAHYQDDVSVTVHLGDGFEGARAVVAQSGKASGTQAAVFVDPPYVSKREWTDLADGVTAIVKTQPKVPVCIWYPIKSLARPRALHSTLRQAGLSGVAVELIHTPLRLQRKRMNGSGMLFINSPGQVADALSPSAHWLGQLLATDGEWQVSTVGW